MSRRAFDIGECQLPDVSFETGSWFHHVQYSLKEMNIFFLFLIMERLYLLLVIEKTYEKKREEQNDEEEKITISCRNVYMLSS